MVQTESKGVDRLREYLLEGIQRGTWRAGDRLPSERELGAQFELSRPAVRESLSELGGLGIIDRSQGRRAVVRAIDSNALARLFPVLLAHDGVKTHRDVFEVRMALETQSAALAAVRRSQADIECIYRAARAYGTRIDGATYVAAVDLDFAFHRAIAEATKNPLFPALLEAISGFVLYAQSNSCAEDPERQLRAHEAHVSIADAIRDGDADRARLEMGYHLNRSARALADEERTA